MTETGRRVVRDAVQSAAARIKLADARDGSDPPVGQAIHGIEPGRWSRDRLGMPREHPCPVTPLGFHGEVLYVIDAQGQLAAIEPGKFGQAKIQQLFGRRQDYLYWAWPRHNKDGVVTNWRAELVRETLYRAAGHLGLWDPSERLRGRGAWRLGDGSLVVHVGDQIWRDGRPEPTGEIDGHYYLAGGELPAPSPEPVPHSLNPAVDLVRMFRTWNYALDAAEPFRRGERVQVEPILLLGWLASSYLAGALPWRPHIFTVGGAGTGKSTLDKILKAIAGRAAISPTDTTPAHIYQRLGYDARPVIIDEAEQKAGSDRARQLVQLARLASEGGDIGRGGADHQAHSFTIRTSFFFAAINPPYMDQQDLGRIAMIVLRELDPLKVGGRPVLSDPETIAPRLLRRMMDGWPAYDALYEDYRTVLRDAGHSSRGQDTYGTLLAAAHLALGEEGLAALGLPFEDEDLRWWAGALAPDTRVEIDMQRPNWERCLAHLLTSRIDAWRHGKQHTVGAIMTEFRRGALSLGDTREMLAQVHLGLAPKGESEAEAETRLQARPPLPEPHYLAIPGRGEALGRIYQQTDWGDASGAVGTWGLALRQAGEPIIVTDKTKNRVRINGVQERCTLIDLDQYDALGG